MTQLAGSSFDLSSHDCSRIPDGWPRSDGMEQGCESHLLLTAVAAILMPHILPSVCHLLMV
jgi:hypothetical protein